MRITPLRLISLGFMVCGLALSACGSNAVTSSGPDLLKLDADCSSNPAACGGCNIDSDCTDPSLPRCYPVDHRCVACLPDNDNCPSGSVCHEVNGEWVCRTSCVANADCQKVGGGSVCCSDFCINPAADVHNCGSCGAACPPVPNGSPGCAMGTCTVANCNAGFDDCDKATLNGCEINTSGDPDNCGACGNVCKPFANGLPTCTAGKCAAICAPGYADCNADTKDGCEIDITFDTGHCGGCGKVCPSPPNAVSACDQGKCGFRCKLGYSDCDGNPANGCEVNNNSDSSNCGHCGNICPLRPNSDAALCQNGQCANTCKQGFGDCDNLAFNGCEADMATNLAHCGGCGKACKNNNAIATCSQAMCTLQCAAGYTDCNMDPKDGCESNVLVDPNNCGGCGNVCPQNLPGCSNGQCVNGYFPVGPQLNVPVNMLAGWNLCYQDVYSNAATSVAQILAMCNGSKLLMACRPNNAQTLTLMAWGPRADVIFDVGTAANGFHDANGTSFYFNASYSWGFFFPGDGVSRSSCDTAAGGRPDARMCWHTGSNNINSGYRCGNNFLNGNAGWDRLLYQMP